MDTDYGLLGAFVLYKSKIDNGPGNEVISPAIVIRTRKSTVKDVVDRWAATPQTVHSINDPNITHETTARPDSFVAELPDDETVDLVVFGLGKTYREYHVKHGDGLGEWEFSPYDFSGQFATP